MLPDEGVLELARAWWRRLYDSTREAGLERCRVTVVQQNGGERAARYATRVVLAGMVTEVAALGADDDPRLALELAFSRLPVSATLRCPRKPL